LSKIFHIKSIHIPQFRFEWHPDTKKVYMIRVGSVPEHAECICDDVRDHGQAMMTSAIWFRGYRYKEAELNPQLTVLHSERINHEAR
jgi:hypothetical protein